ncbi:MAG: transcriptional repressor [Smithella sp.]|jgi:Fur family peroxide stress response transcriptional regulator
MKNLQANILRSGLKVTPQRLAILKYLKENMNHPTAEKVHNDLLNEYPAMSLTTVYKALSSFVEAGMVKELDIDAHKMRFDFIIDPHDHFHCRVCDNVYDIEHAAAIAVDDLKNKKSREGHHVDTISINLKGVCRYCEAIGS